MYFYNSHAEQLQKQAYDKELRNMQASVTFCPRSSTLCIVFTLQPHHCTNMFWSRAENIEELIIPGATFPVEPVSALAVEQQLVVHVWQQELDTPALHTQLVFHQNDGTAVVAGLWTRDQADLITGGADKENQDRGQNSLLHMDRRKLLSTPYCGAFGVISETNLSKISDFLKDLTS